MKHIKTFDSLRGLMAFWVVLSHTFSTFDLFLPSALKKVFNVGFAVEVFIILSGFVIFFLLDKKQESYKNFIFRRFFRLFPVYWVLLFIAAISMNGQLLLWQELGSEGSYWQGRLSTITASIANYDYHLFLHIPLLQGIIHPSVLPASDFTFIEPAWSLSLEWQFYLIAPFICWGIVNYSRKESQSMLALISIAIIISGLYGKGGSGFLPKEMHLFILGIGSYYLWKFIVQDRKWYVLLLCCLCTAIVIRSIPLLIWFMFFTIALSNNVILMSIRSVLESRPFEFLGKISYPMYLVHTMVVFIPLYLNINNILALSISVQIAITILLTIILSYFIHLTIERPGVNLGFWLGKRKLCSRNSAIERKEQQAK